MPLVKSRSSREQPLPNHKYSLPLSSCKRWGASGEMPNAAAAPHALCPTADCDQPTRMKQSPELSDGARAATSIARMLNSFEALTWNIRVPVVLKESSSARFLNPDPTPPWWTTNCAGQNGRVNAVSISKPRRHARLQEGLRAIVTPNEHGQVTQITSTHLPFEDHVKVWGLLVLHDAALHRHPAHLVVKLDRV
jgi:hypothetical protein